MSGDFYERLGVPPTADQAQIHDTYVARISEAHPDFVVNSDHHVVKNLNIAYRVLSNSERRRKYDVALVGDLCPWCGKLFFAYALDEYVVIYVVDDVKDGCVVCGRFLAA